MSVTSQQHKCECAAPLCRIQLPDALPPSFKGTAVRYSYQLEAKAIFAAQSWKGTTPSSATAPSEAHSQSSTPSTDSPAQHGLPPITPSSNTSPHLMRFSSSNNMKLSRGREAVGQQQRKGPGIVHVKTPVHLWPAVGILCTIRCCGASLTKLSMSLSECLTAKQSAVSFKLSMKCHPNASSRL